MTRLRPLALASLLFPGPAWGECDEPTQRADLALEVQRATQAFRQLNRQGFIHSRDSLLTSLPCLAEPLQPSDAASIHGLMALSAFLDKDDGRSVASLSAAVRSQADFELPRDLFPDGHPLRLHLQVARSLQPGILRPLPQPAEGLVSVDGTVTELAPGDRPSVLQWTVATLEVRDTSYLAVGADMPDWGPLPPVEPGVRSRHPWGLVGAAGGGAVVAGGLYALAAGRHARFIDAHTPYTDLPGLQIQANALSVAASGAGLLTLGLSGAAVLRW